KVVAQLAPSLLGQSPYNSWPALSATAINELCFRYEYDGWRRMIAKKVPGSAWAYMVYDQHDRPVFTQDGNMRGRSWWLTPLYDALNRPIETAMMTGYSGGPNDLQAYLDGVGDNNTSLSNDGYQTNSIPANLVISKAEPGRKEYQASSKVTLQPGFHFIS